MFGRFSPFRDRSSPPTRNDACHVVASDGNHFQLNEAVIEREQIPRLHCAAAGPQKLTETRCWSPITCVGRERERVIGLQFNLIHSKIPDAHFRPGQIRHDRHSASHLSGGGADVFDDLPVAGELAV